MARQPPTFVVTTSYPNSNHDHHHVKYHSVSRTQDSPRALPTTQGNRVGGFVWWYRLPAGVGMRSSFEALGWLPAELVGSTCPSWWFRFTPPDREYPSRPSTKPTVVG